MNARRLEILLERLRAGELSPDQEREVRDWLGTPEGRRRLEEMEADDARTFRALPPESVTREIVRRRDALRRSEGAARAAWIRWLPAPAALAACAIVLFALRTSPGPETSASAQAPASAVPQAAAPVAPTPVEPASPRPATPARIPSATAPDPTRTALAIESPSDPAGEGLRTKGEIRRLRVHRIDPAGGSASPLADGAPAAPGDILQVGLLAGPRKWVAVVSVDGAGRTTRHLPETGETAVSAEEAVEAPHSFQLDAAPGFERFVLFASDRPFSLAEAERILSQARGSRELRLPAGWTSESIHLSKPEARP
jgi:hypothetical protein